MLYISAWYSIQLFLFRDYGRTIDQEVDVRIVVVACSDVRCQLDSNVEDSQQHRSRMTVRMNHAQIGTHEATVGTCGAG
jgi:hypothetical protein